MTLVPQLEHDLLDAARRRRRRRVWRPALGRRAGALALVGAVAAAGGAGAGTGLIAVGDQEATPVGRPSDGLRYTTARTVVATGRTPRAGRWELTMTGSDLGPCLGLRRPDDPYGIALGEGCGDPSTFSAATSSNGFPLDRPELANRWKLFFGRVPEQAARVELVAAGGVRRSAPTHDGPPGIDGDFYMLEAPGRTRDAEIFAFDADGRSLGPGLLVAD